MMLSSFAAVLLAVPTSAQTVSLPRSAEMTAGMDSASAGAGRIAGASLAPLSPALSVSGLSAAPVFLGAPALSPAATPAPAAESAPAQAAAPAAEVLPSAVILGDVPQSGAAPASVRDASPRAAALASGRRLTARFADSATPGADFARTQAALESFYNGIAATAARLSVDAARVGGSIGRTALAPRRGRALAGLRRGAAAAVWAGPISFRVAEAAQSNAPVGAHATATAAGLVLASKALVSWYGGVALLHAVEEGRGRLWDYFGRISGNAFLQRLRAVPGLVLIVLPALALQLVSAWKGLVDGSPFWLGALIGARLGDAFFSHFRPASLWPLTNPGLPTARVYLVDGLLLSLLYLSLLVHAPAAWGGLLAGAAFFAVLLPLFKLTGKWLR